MKTQYQKVAMDFLYSLYLVSLIAIAMVCGCQAHTDQDLIEDLGKEIAKAQRDEVWTGGDEYARCYMWVHRWKFLATDGLSKTERKAKGKKRFMAGVIALKSLPAGERERLLKLWSRPIDPTWAETGKVGKGTTEAGQITEREIAETLVDLIRDLVDLPSHEIQEIWLTNASWWTKLGSRQLMDAD